jgi:hypothetical protein
MYADHSSYKKRMARSASDVHRSGTFRPQPTLHPFDQGLLELRLDRLRHGQGFLVVRERLLRATRCIQRAAHRGVDACRVGCQGFGLLCFREGLRSSLLRQQDAGLLCMTQRSGEGNIEVSVVEEDAVVDDRRGLELLELFVGIQRAGAKLKAGEDTGTHQDRAIDRSRHIVWIIEVERIRGDQWLAGNAVVAVVRNPLAEVGKPAILNSVRVEVALHGFQLLPPIGAGIAE